ncbi:MAG: hypothetical protein M1834_006955 [Cirrosporium novae-zelandiae]|nr:MAG: hypothetical protein M1834_006955 [Cirrosporium novae-zelandiae]
MASSPIFYPTGPRSSVLSSPSSSNRNTLNDLPAIDEDSETDFSLQLSPHFYSHEHLHNDDDDDIELAIPSPIPRVQRNSNRYSSSEFVVPIPSPLKLQHSPQCSEDSIEAAVPPPIRRSKTEQHEDRSLSWPHLPPLKTTNSYPMLYGLSLPSTPRSSYSEKHPSPYTSPFHSPYNNIISPGGVKFNEIRNRRFRNNKYIARRGGWRRLTLIIFLLVAVIIALGVGLGVGVHIHNHNGSLNSASQSSNPPSPPLSSPSFPAGSYSFNAFLETITTNCTSDAVTWQCFPYTTYQTSPSGSMVTFQWIISPTEPRSSNFKISSSGNPFAPHFSNISMSLVDAGLHTEHYRFQTTMGIDVVPTTTLLPNQSTTICKYYDTILEGNLYTKKRPAGSAASTVTSASPSSSSPGSFEDWPYAVDVFQVANGGTDVPSCYLWNNGETSVRITGEISPQPSSRQCACEWRNYDPGGD